MQRELFDDLAFVAEGSDEPVQLLSAPGEDYVDDTRGLLKAMLRDVRDGTDLAPSGRDHLRSLGLCFAAWRRAVAAQWSTCRRSWRATD